MSGLVIGLIVFVIILLIGLVVYWQTTPSTPPLPPLPQTGTAAPQATVPTTAPAPTQVAPTAPTQVTPTYIAPTPTQVAPTAPTQVTPTYVASAPAPTPAPAPAPTYVAPAPTPAPAPTAPTYVAPAPAPAPTPVRVTSTTTATAPTAQLSTPIRILAPGVYTIKSKYHAADCTESPFARARPCSARWAKDHLSLNGAGSSVFSQWRFDVTDQGPDVYEVSVVGNRDACGGSAMGATACNATGMARGTVGSSPSLYRVVPGDPAHPGTFKLLSLERSKSGCAPYLRRVPCGTANSGFVQWGAKDNGKGDLHWVLKKL